VSEKTSMITNTTSSLPQSYVCKSCGGEIRGMPRTTIECPHCSNLNFLYKNGEARYVKKYIPNKFTLKERTINLLLSLVIIVYGTVGLTENDIYIPGKRGRGIHFYGFTAFLVYVAMMVVSISMLSVIVDHYDERDNERKYKSIKSAATALAVSLFILAVFLKILEESVRG